MFVIAARYNARGTKRGRSIYDVDTEKSPPSEDAAVGIEINRPGRACRHNTDDDNSPGVVIESCKRKPPTAAQPVVNGSAMAGSNHLIQSITCRIGKQTDVTTT